MFRTSALVALVLALSVYALPSPQESGTQCESGQLTCCDATYPANSSEANVLLRALKLNADDYAPGTVVAATCGGGGVNVGGGSGCSNIPVCCEDNTFGAIAVGCTVVPVNV